MGDDINTAARLMSYAKWGSIYISNKTEEQVRAYFNLSDRFDLRVKGKQILIPPKPGKARNGQHAVWRERPHRSSVETRIQTLQACARDYKIAAGKSSPSSVTVTGKSRLRRDLKARCLSKKSPTISFGLKVSHVFQRAMSYWLAAVCLLRACGFPRKRRRYSLHDDR